MISEFKVMRGPNIWSAECHRLIVLKLDLQGYDNLQTESIASAYLRLFPSSGRELAQIGRSGRDAKMFLARLLALTGIELQSAISPKVSFHSAELLGHSSYYAFFEYEEEEIGEEAAYIAGRIMKCLAGGDLYDELTLDLEDLSRLYDQVFLGPSTSAIVNAARERDIPVKKIVDGRFILLGQGKHQRKIEGSIGETTSNISVDIAGDKETTKKLLEDAQIPVPAGKVVTGEDELEACADYIGFPLVTKPLDGHQGKNITANIRTESQLREGFRMARSYSRRVIVERYITGDDYRFLVVNYKLVAVARRSAACVTGDGRSSIAELVEKLNADPVRGEGHGNILTRIKLDQVSMRLLAQQDMTVDSIPRRGEKVILKDTANLSTGGTAEDVTDDVHPDNVLLAERTARIIGLDICGIDIMTESVRTPIASNGGAVLEVNAAPGLRMHISPSSGKSRDVAKAIVEHMFPDKSKGRVPIVAITGTNGKTTTSRLMAHVALTCNYQVGFTTTDGIYIGGRQIQRGDCSGPKSTDVVLHEPTVDFAVLEVARGGILRSGLAFDKCDVGIVTNVAADHLGLKDIYTVEDMARVKAVVPQAVKRDGYAVLNAGNDLVYNMRKDLKCNVALFSIDGSSERVSGHCRKGGIACVYSSEGNIVLHVGDKEIVVEHVKNIPLTLGGKADFMIENVMPVVIACYVLGFDMDMIRKALRSFHPSAEQAPGRLNIIKVKDVNVMIDYAHNPHSIKAFAGLMDKIKDEKTGIVTGIGDRRDEDIFEIGRLAAEMYDRIIIRVDKDTRGRSADDIVSLVEKGIRSANRKVPYKLVPDTRDALEEAVKGSRSGGYVVLNAENTLEAIQIVNEMKEEMSSPDTKS